MLENMTLLNESVQSINKCEDLLKEISTSCCMPERNPKMTQAFSKLENIVKNIDLAKNNAGEIQDSIQDIGEFGSHIGFLYATCCTDTREPLYQQIYKEINTVHTKLWQHLGHAH